jgi:hypothetical protein
MKLNRSRKTLAIFSLALVCGLAQNACGSDDDNVENPIDDGDDNTGGGNVGDGDGDDMDGNGGEGGQTGDGDDDAAPVYAITTQVLDGEVSTSYVVLTDSMASGDLSPEGGIEIAGRALGVGPNEGGALFVASGPEITRYDLQDNGQLKKGATVSFIPAGLTNIGEYQGQFQFVSEEKAYFFDGSTGKIVVWNPQEMTYSESISLSELVHADETLTFGGVPIVMGDKIVAFPGWRSSDNTKIISRAAVVTLDTKTDTVEIVTDDTCGYARDGVLTDDGVIYMATEAYGAAVYELNPSNAPAPCLLRFDTKADEFDDSFYVDITTLFDGEVGGTLLTGPDNQPYLLTLDSELYDGAAHPRVLASSPVWNWAKLTVGDTPSVELLDGVTTTGSILPSLLGDEIYLPLLEGREATHFSLFGANGPQEAGTSIIGTSFSSVKLK